MSCGKKIYIISKIIIYIYIINRSVVPLYIYILRILFVRIAFEWLLVAYNRARKQNLFFQYYFILRLTVENVCSQNHVSATDSSNLSYFFLDLTYFGKVRIKSLLIIIIYTICG